jgi:hypothetical protein
LVVDEDDGTEVDDADNSAESAPVLGAAFRSGVEAFLYFSLPQKAQKTEPAEPRRSLHLQPVAA